MIRGLRAHPPIKIRKKHGQYMAFNMKYLIFFKHCLKNLLN